MLTLPQYIPRATGLIDAILYSNTQALPQFTNIDGVNTLIGSVKVSRCLSARFKYTQHLRRKCSCWPVLLFRQPVTTWLKVNCFRT